MIISSFDNTISALNGNNSIFEFEVPFFDLKSNWESVPSGKELIIKSLGYKLNNVQSFIEHEVEEVITESINHLDIKTGFKIFSDIKIKLTNSTILIDNVTFNSDKIITKRLRYSTAIAVFVATIGKKLTEWSNQTLKEDPLKGFIIDTFGSIAVEATCDWLEKKLEEIAKQLNWKITNRYSPGYCNWFVKEQHKLFSLLPKNFCGITLTESALMIPIKSVSGIIGLGPNVKKEEYECSVCNIENCFRKR